jgi:hypothetical protein
MDHQCAKHDSRCPRSRNAEGKKRNKRTGRRGVVGTFRRRNPLDSAMTEPLRVARHASLQGVREHRRNRRSCAREYSHQEPDNRAAPERPPRVEPVFGRRHEVRNTFLVEHNLLIALHAFQDFGHREEANRHTYE